MTIEEIEAGGRIEDQAICTSSISAHGTRLGPLYAFTKGMDHAYLWSVPVALSAFALSFRLKEIKLRDSEAPINDPELPADTR